MNKMIKMCFFVKVFCAVVVESVSKLGVGLYKTLLKWLLNNSDVMLEAFFRCSYRSILVCICKNKNKYGLSQNDIEKIKCEILKCDLFMKNEYVSVFTKIFSNVLREYYIELYVNSNVEKSNAIFSLICDLLECDLSSFESDGISQVKGLIDNRFVICYKIILKFTSLYTNCIINKHSYLKILNVITFLCIFVCLFIYLHMIESYI